MKMQKQQGSITVFISYAQADHAVRDHLATHLSQLKRDGFIEAWSDQQILAGTDRVQQIDLAIRRSSLILLLISAEFLASDACYDGEMKHALERHRAGEARVIPIIVRPCDWQTSPFAHLQCLPRNTHPLTSWDNQDEAFTEVAKDIRAVVELLCHPVVIVPCLPHQPFSKHLAQDLTARGIPFWETETTQEPAILREHIREAAVVVVITSPGIEPTRTRKDVENLAKRYQRPLIGLWIIDTARDEEMDVSVPSPDHKWIVVDPGQEQSGVQELCAAIQRKRFHHSGLSLASPQEEVILPEPRNPYKGLDAFTAADAGDFFGRTALVETLLTTVKTTLSQEKQGKPPARLLAVVGASGSGKSSLVQAGLLPALHAGRVTHSDTWLYLDPIIPGAHPLQKLASLLLEYVPDKRLERIDGDLHSASLSALHSYARMIAKQRGSKHVVLVVDQFEEIFTLTEQEQERQQFLDLLVTACTKQGGPLIVILTLRADFYGHVMRYQDLYELIRDHQIPMLAMVLSDLRAVITEPAKLPDVHLTFEGNLIGDLLGEVQGQVGALPLLQFTLEQLVEQREGHLLTEQAYQEMDGIRGALTKHADECYHALPSDAHRDLARDLFLRLLDPGTTEQETTRRRATLTEFASADERQTTMMHETIAAFVKARLLTITANERVGTTTVTTRLRTTTADEKTGTTTVEVSHEALIRQWPQLVDWLRTARDDIHLQQNISRAAATWERNTRSGDHLYRGKELKAAQAWAKRNRPSERETAFLHAGAVRKTQLLASLIVIVCLLVSSMGFTGWYWLLRAAFVTTLDDNVIGSLRYCVENAPAGSTIRFAPWLSGTIKLRETLSFPSDEPLTLQGPGADKVTISSDKNADAHIQVPPHATITISGLSFKNSETVVNGFLYNEGSLTLTNSDISHNKTISIASNGVLVNRANGGGIYNSGTLIINNSSISDNTVTIGSGGGISNLTGGTLTLNHSTVSGNMANKGNSGAGGISNSGSLILNNSTVSGNRTTGTSGGISNDRILILNNSIVSDNKAHDDAGIGSEGTITLNHSMILHNTATQNGGGITNYAGTLTLNHSTISSNTATSGYGGGILNLKGGSLTGGSLTLNHSTISSNTATSGYGGGIFSDSGTLTLTNSLVSSNTAAFGSGIFNYFHSHITLVFCTIVNNSATDRHSFDIVNQDSTSQMYLKASIVGGNRTQDISIAGAMTSGGYNVIQHSSFLQFVGNTQITDRSIDDLSHVFRPSPVSPNKNDPTQTYQLLPNTNNPAYNAVPKEACTDADGHPVLTDQQGRLRPGKNKQKCDSGAYESQVSP